MSINSTAQMWIIVAAINLLAALVIVPAIILLYPRELWVSEISVSLMLSFIIATPAAYFMAYQVRKNQRLNDELQRLVDRDRLTDASTRDYFFSKMIEKPEAYGVSLMIDIDHFKAVNDTYGHLAGDEVIRSVAKLLKENIREEDILARFGGEEFIVFLNCKDKDAGFKIAERMRKQISDWIVEFENLELNVTVSIGASFKEAFTNLEQSIKHADDALYQAKRAGRNRTIFFDALSGLKPSTSASDFLQAVPQ